MEPERKFPTDAKDYKLYEEVGDGVSATVHRALCIPLNEIVAIKVLDLERCNSDLDGIRREVQTMNLIDHPNLLRAYCSFIAGYSLWVVMPYMAGGSCLHIMKSAFPEGFEEPVIATLLRETLKALVYLHLQGHIHRDVKAGNILVDTNGSVKVADFGVSACMFDTGDRQRSRNTFVGTPCWMAPEVMQQLHGYDFKADIWSFGITALELAHGHAPFSKYPPMKVLLMTLQNAPPGLDYERDRRFSKSFKELVSACLVKDPKKRPTAEKLLKHQFFKHARSYEYVARSILDGLPPLGERFKMLKAKEADLLGQNKALYGDKEQLSQQEYIRGISAWNFNLEDLKNQAALIRDDYGMPTAELADTNVKQKERDWESYNPAISNDRLPLAKTNDSGTSPSCEDSINDIHDLESSLASFPVKPIQALKGCFDVVEDEASASSPDREGPGRTEDENPFPVKSSKELESERIESENVRQKSSLPRHVMVDHKKNLSGPLMTDNVFPPKKIAGEENKELLYQKYPQERNFSGPLLYRQKGELNNFSSVEDPSDGAVVKLKGRFKMTSGDGPTSTNCYFNPAGGVANPSISTSSVLSSLQSMLQQNTIQREEIVKLMKFLEQTSGKQMEPVDLGSKEMFQVSLSTKEKELQAVAVNLHQSVRSLTDELQRVKLKNAELERLLNAKKQSSV